MKNYYKPTPAKWRKLGDALLAVSTMITAASIATSHSYFALIALGIGVAGKFLTNFFNEKPE